MLMKLLKCSFLCLALCTMACQTKEKSRARIEAAVAENVRLYSEKKRTECYRNALEKANTLVDSILLEEARQQIALSSDSLLLLLRKPVRPARPRVIEPLDSGPVEPLIRRE